MMFRLFARQQFSAMVLAAAGLILCSSNLSANMAKALYTPDIEQSLETVFEALRDQRLLDAGTEAEILARRFPDFLLGQLLHAELQSVQALSTTLLDSDQPFSPRLMDLLLEAQSRISDGHLAVTDTQVPTNLLQLGNDIEHVVAVDLEHSRLYLINNQQDGPRLVTQHYAGSGRGGYGKLVEGDLRTPTGIYRVTQFRSDESLPPLYGSGALTLDYPNPVDRLQRRTGSGIWLHGVPPDNLSRAPRSSEGCVVMPNDMLTQLQQSVNPANTLVMLSGDLDWITPQTLSPAKRPFLKLFERYRTAWFERDEAALTQLYNGKLYATKVAPYIEQKTNFHETLSGVSPDDITLLRYPRFPDREEQERIMMRFTIPATNQENRLVTLFWEQTPDQDWRIVHIDEEAGPA